MYTVLVVDDNPSIVDIFVNMLEQGGTMFFQPLVVKERLKS